MIRLCFIDRQQSNDGIDGAQEATPEVCPTLTRDEPDWGARQYLDTWNTDRSLRVSR